MLATMTVATFSSAYMLTGFSKDKFILIIDNMPQKNEWILIPIMFISFIIVHFLWHKLIEILRPKSKLYNVNLKEFVDEHLKNNALYIKK